jgi:hypothetical protein
MPKVFTNLNYLDLDDDFETKEDSFLVFYTAFGNTIIIRFV